MWKELLFQKTIQPLSPLFGEKKIICGTVAFIKTLEQNINQTRSTSCIFLFQTHIYALIINCCFRTTFSKTMYFN